MALLESDPVDWLLDADGDLVIPLVRTRGVPAVVQRLKIRLRAFRGEWYQDLDFGVRYVEGNGVAASEALLGNRYDAARARAEFRDVILSTPNVETIHQLDVDFDARTRKLSVQFRVSTTFGESDLETLSVRV